LEVSFFQAGNCGHAGLRHRGLRQRTSIETIKL
jgi:hypothetical protein